MVENALKPRHAWWKLILMLLLTATMCALLLGHVKGVNGPWYWRWAWRRLAFWPLYPSMLLAAAPFAVAQWLYLRGRRVRLALGCLFLSSLGLALVALACQPPTGLRRLPLIIENTVNTSYYTDAAILYEQKNISISQWMYQYPQVVPLLHVHAAYKPPGLMLYFVALLAIFGKGKLAATVGGLGMALVMAAAAPACYAMFRAFGEEIGASFYGASYLALCPSLLLFFPMFDEVYVTLSCILLILYAKTIMGGARRWRIAAAFGALMAGVLFLSYIFLIFGFFYLVYWGIFLADRGAGAAGRAAWRLFFAAVLCVALYGILWVFTGFDPIATFRVIEKTQTIALIPLMRPFPWHMFIDVLDFAMGSGYLAYLLVAIYLWSQGMTSIFGRSSSHRLVQVSLLQIAVVAGAALLPGETARLWMLLLPLLMAPVGVELARWPASWRFIAFACLWVLLVVICQNMTFIYMGPELDGPRW